MVSYAGRRPPRSPVVSRRHVVVGLGLLSLALTFHPESASAQFFFEPFDDVAAPGLPPGWTGSGDQPWTTVSTTFDTDPNSAFGPAPGVTSDNRLDSPPLKITSPRAQLVFRNRFDFTGSDGAVLEISSPNVNGGAFTDIVTAGGGFVTGSYTGSISSVLGGHPLAGRFVWRGNSGGSFLDTRVNLPAALAGQTVRLRWRVGTSSSGASVGQFIDDVSIAGGGLATDLRLTAAQSADVVPAGGLLTYTLTVRNDGPVAGSSGILFQRIAAGTTFESLVAAAGWTCMTPAPGGTGLVFCQRPTLPAATLDTFTLVIRVSPTAPDGASILGAPALTTSPAVADVQNTFAMLAATVSRPGAPARTVTDCGDTGAAGQLRQTIAAADPGDTVLVPACPVIALTAGALTLGKDLLLQGAGPGQTVLDAGGTSGVLTITAGNVLLTGLTLRNGSARGINLVTGTLTLRDVELSDNQGSVGGGLFSFEGALTVDRTLVSGNQASQGAGLNVQGPTLITHSTLTGNSLTGMGAGGGLAVVGFSVTVIRNSTLSGNSSGAGFGVLAAAAPVALTNTTIAGNTGGPRGSLLSFITSGGITLRNTIVSGNTATTGPNCGSPVLSLGHNLESGTDCGFVAAGDLAGVDPLLGPLQNNGGFTPTHALLAGSPAIDAGDPTECPARDQRGFVRPADGDGTGAAACDIGAVELLRFQGQLGLAVNQPTLRPGDTLRVDLSGVNPGPGAVVDVLFGFVLPVPAADAGCPPGDLVLAFFRPGFSGADVVCSSAPPDQFPLAFENVTFPGAFPATTVPGLVALPLPPGMPPGSYVVFIAVIAAGALEDGRLDPGDLLAVGTALFTVLP